MSAFEFYSRVVKNRKRTSERSELKAKALTRGSEWGCLENTKHLSFSFYNIKQLNFRLFLNSFLVLEVKKPLTLKTTCNTKFDINVSGNGFTKRKILIKTNVDIQHGIISTINLQTVSIWLQFCVCTLFMFLSWKIMGDHVSAEGYIMLDDENFPLSLLYFWNL